MWVIKRVLEAGLGNLADDCFQRNVFVITHPGTSRAKFFMHPLRLRKVAIGWYREPPLRAAEGYSRGRGRHVSTQVATGRKPHEGRRVSSNGGIDEE